jgi:hypothetical protein
MRLVLDDAQSPSYLAFKSASIGGSRIASGSSEPGGMSIPDSPSWIEPAPDGTATAPQGAVLLRWSAGRTVGFHVRLHVSVRNGLPYDPRFTRECILVDDGAAVLPWSFLAGLGGGAGSIIDLVLERSETARLPVAIEGEVDGALRLTWVSAAETSFVVGVSATR